MGLSGETWGISGTTFLIVYIALAAVVLIAAVNVRRSLGGGRQTDPSALQSRPEDVAYLNAGPELAVYAALSGMHVDGGIATAGRSSAGIVQAVGTVPAQASELQRAIHAAAARPVPRRTLPSEPGVAQALVRIRERLEQAGLLLTAEQRRAYRRPGFWMLVLLALGVVRLVAGIANGRPFEYLLFVLFLVFGATVVLLTVVRTRTRAGDVALQAQRLRHASLSPSMRPDWGAVGAGGAALSVGVFGVGALMAASPAFAEDLEAQKSAAMGGMGGSSGGGGDGGSSGGDGGGGGCGGGGCGGGCGG